jgi:hypothetical protein
LEATILELVRPFDFEFAQARSKHAGVQAQYLSRTAELPIRFFKRAEDVAKPFREWTLSRAEEPGEP